MSLTGPSSTSPTAHAWWPTSWSLPTYSLSQQRRMRFIFAVLFWVLFAYLRGLVIAICVASVAEECRKTCIKHLCISARLLTEIIEAILCRFRPPGSMQHVGHFV